MAQAERQIVARPNIDSIREAHYRIASRVHRTPVFMSSSLNEIAGAQLFFKCENLQRTGSFKIRGATNAVFSLTDIEARRGVATHSSGNHAAALALAARTRRIPSWIVMPSNSPAAKRRAVESYGGRITLCEPTLAAREAVAKEVVKRTGAQFIHPYNDIRIIAGQGTVGIELLEEVPDLDFVIAPISGGGLISGVAIAVKALRPEVHVIGTEPANSDEAFRSFASGHIEPASSAYTIADGLRAVVCPLTFSIIRELVDAISLVREEEISATMRIVWERMKLIIEPSAAVAVAPVLNRSIGAESKRVGIILSGGNLDFDDLPFCS